MIEVLHLFPKLNSSLIQVLDKLEPAQWNKSTICRDWTVKDIAAHLLDGALRRLSQGRDGCRTETPGINSYNDLLAYLNELNAIWVNAYRRISPEILKAQLKTAQDELYAYLQSLDPDAPALYPVTWAGESSSANSFDIAREYTERWLHQQQIRQAVGAESVLSKELYHPFLEVCMQALPYHFKETEALTGSLVTVEIVGEAGGQWSVIRSENSWEFTNLGGESSARVYIDQNIAWMLFSKGMDIQEGSQFWQVTGDRTLGIHALKMVAFMVRKN